MSAPKGKSIHLFVAAIILLAATAVFGAGENAPLLPTNTIIEDAYSPGIGVPVGKALLVQGQVVILHAGQTKGFYARNNHPLFKGDTLITLDKGRIRIRLEDDSIITLASQSKLVLNKIVYDQDAGTRSSFVGMDKGKARFLIKKLVDFKHSEFKVKTKTAVAGVRGSEFIIIATDLLTEIMTLADTRLEVLSLAMPCKEFKGYPPPPECEVKPILLMDFEKTIVKLGELPAEAEIVTPVEVDQMEKDFTVTPDTAIPEGAVEAPGQQASAQTPVLAPEEEIMAPEVPLLGPMLEVPPAVVEFLEIEPPVNPIEALRDEAVREDLMDNSLPGFPGVPD